MLNNIIVRLIAYYVAWLLGLSGLFHLSPEILYYVSQERERIFVGQGLEVESDVAAPLGDIQDGVLRLIDPTHTIPMIVALVLAFGVTLPITWVYQWTRPRKKYNQSFAHTLLVIPIAIALVVFLVKGSLALAFSLAGIVAAVRFRTSLDDPVDSVYMLMAIGIGLAAGVQLTTVAYIASLIFVVTSISVWKIDFGAAPPVISGWRIDTSGELGNPATPESPYNAQVEVHTTKVEAAQKATAVILKSSTKHWQVADVIKNRDGTAIVVFDVRLKKSVALPTFIRDIEESGKGHINSVKLRGQETETVGRRGGIIANAASRK